MNKEEFNKIKAKANLMKYSAFRYIEYNNLSNYDMQADNSQLILMLGYNREAKMHEYIWAANQIDSLIKSLKRTESFYLSFVPLSWVSPLKQIGLRIRNAWHDYRLDNLDNINIENKTGFDFLKLSEIDEASQTAIQCKGQSRGFTGQTPEWFKEWLTGIDNTKNKAVLVQRTTDGKISGLVCVGTYRNTNKDKLIIWIREAAVKPEFQNQGIGRKLITNALVYGKEKGAEKAFLSVDEDNVNAIHLYKSLGFIPCDDDSEITMIKD